MLTKNTGKFESALSVIFVIMSEFEDGTDDDLLNIEYDCMFIHIYALPFKP